MKKLILLACMLPALFANAQNFKFCSYGEELADGQTVDLGQVVGEFGYCSLIYNPMLTVTTTQAGSVSVTINFTKSETAPELSGMDAIMNYLEGIGEPKVQICAPNIAFQCQTVGLGTSKTFTGSLAAGATENLLIEQVFTLGSSVTSVDDLTIKSEFEVTVAQGGESKTVKFVINRDAASLSDLSADVKKSCSGCYNLQGRKLQQPQKGINIVDGKKILVK